MPSKLETLLSARSTMRDFLSTLSEDDPGYNDKAAPIKQHMEELTKLIDELQKESVDKSSSSGPMQRKSPEGSSPMTQKPPNVPSAGPSVANRVGSSSGHAYSNETTRNMQPGGYVMAKAQELSPYQSMITGNNGPIYKPGPPRYAWMQPDWQSSPVTDLRPPVVTRTDSGSSGLSRSINQTDTPLIQPIPQSSGGSLQTSGPTTPTTDASSNKSSEPETADESDIEISEVRTKAPSIESVHQRADNLTTGSVESTGTRKRQMSPDIVEVNATQSKRPMYDFQAFINMCKFHLTSEMALQLQQMSQHPRHSENMQHFGAIFKDLSKDQQHFAVSCMTELESKRTRLKYESRTLRNRLNQWQSEIVAIKERTQGHIIKESKDALDMERLRTMCFKTFEQRNVVSANIDRVVKLQRGIMVGEFQNYSQLALHLEKIKRRELTVDLGLESFVKLIRPGGTQPAQNRLPGDSRDQNANSLHQKLVAGQLFGLTPDEKKQFTAWLAHSQVVSPGWIKLSNGTTMSVEQLRGQITQSRHAEYLNQQRQQQLHQQQLLRQQQLLQQQQQQREMRSLFPRPSGASTSASAAGAATQRYDEDEFDGYYDGGYGSVGYTGYGSFDEPVFDREKLEELLENIRMDEEIPPESRTGTPEQMSVNLYEHQKLGLTWLQGVEDTTKGGLLADDMGLGKTIQMIQSDNENKATLIVAPVALLQQWEREIKKCIKPEYALKTLIYHFGSNPALKKAKKLDFNKWDCVITTYQTVLLDATKAMSPDDEAPLFRTSWHRIILDEAHYIKNRLSKTSVACSKLTAKYRWCLSGTPMQNKVEELYPILRFLRLEPYNNLQKFQRDIVRGIEKFRDGKAVQRLNVLLRAIALRRTKDSKVDGKPLLQLPEKHIELLTNTFDDDEMDFYKDFESGAQARVNKYMKENSFQKNYQNMLVLLLRLRQACCHPKLIEKSELLKNEKASKSRMTVDMLDHIRSLSPEVVKRLLEEDDSFTCPICMDACDKSGAMIMYPCGHLMCSECIYDFFSKNDTSARDEAEDDSRGRKGPRATCFACRADLLQSESIDYLTFDLIFNQNMSNEEIKALWREERQQRLAEQRQRRDMLLKRKDDLRAARLLKSDMDLFEDELEGFHLNRESSIKPDLQEDVKNDIRDALDPNYNGGRGEGEDEDEKMDVKRDESEVLDQITECLGMARLFTGGWISSTKIEKCLRLIQTIERDYPGEKILIFSQFTSLLDLMEVPLIGKGMEYLRYDGSMTSGDRNQTVVDFFEKPEIKVMLISLKAGNVGLTLTCASHVIIMDPFWNPYIEDQAMDRAHRIGQLKEVHVHRLMIADTVEDRILKLQEKKREVIEAAWDETGLKKLGRLTKEDLLYLFGMGSLRNPNNNNNNNN